MAALRPVQLGERVQRHREITALDVDVRPREPAVHVEVDGLRRTAVEVEGQPVPGPRDQCAELVEARLRQRAHRVDDRADVGVDAVGTGGVAAVLGLRGAGGLAMSARRSTDFARLDRRYYSPLCLILAVSCTAVAVLGQA